MKKKTKRIILISVVTSILVLTGIIFGIVSQEAFGVTTKWCFPEYGNAKCDKTINKYIIQPDKLNQDTRLTESTTEAWIDVRAGGQTFLCDYRMSDCEYEVKVKRPPFYEDPDAIYYKITYSDNSIIEACYKIKSIGGEEKYKIPIEIDKGDKIEVGYFDYAFFAGIECNVNKVKKDVVKTSQIQIKSRLFYLDIIEGDGYRDSYIGFGCNLKKYGLVTPTGTKADTQTIEDNTDITRENKNCDEDSCQYLGIVNWLDKWNCADYIIHKLVTYNDKEYYCARGAKGNLWEIGKLKIDDAIYKYPFKYSNIEITCCPGTSLGGKVCKQEGDKFYWSGEEKQECISDADCEGRNINPVYVSENKMGYFECVNKICVVHDTFTPDCSPSNPCSFGICSKGKCVSVKEREITEGEEKLECKWYEDYYEKETCGFWCKLGLSKPIEEVGCKTSPTLIFGIIIGVFMLMIIIILLIKPTQLTQPTYSQYLTTRKVGRKKK
mgnify:CR=1 FL=1